jgi:LacI family transcriptional regulator, repressor for deo operon, udp, cdd, tsx, nupC, and nupG
MTATSTRRPRRARIEDVALAANVSVATVSRALRGLPNVAASTSERVHRVARELDYQPDPMASRLAAGRTKTVIVVVPHLASWYFSTVVAGAEAVSNEAGYDFLVTSVGSLDECARILDDSYRIERRTDGIVLVNIPATDEQARSLRERNVALSTVGTRATGAPSVIVDDVAVGALAGRTLVELGHRRIGLISGHGGAPLNFEVPKRRQRGFAEALGDAELVLERDLVVDGNFNIDGSQEAMATLLDLPDPPTAVFAMSDEMAFGALMELGARGLRPGVDVSILGVDDHEFSRVVGLSTIRQQVSAQGAAAARMLLAALRGEESESDSVISPVELLTRDTTGPAGRAEPNERKNLT